MIHKMKLVDFAFNEIKSGNKDIEVRLLDEKRSLIKENDIIEFTNIDTGEVLKVKVLKLYIFNSFEELFSTFSLKRLGLEDNTSYEIMNSFYSTEDQKKYKALGINIKKM